ncbi:hypothetical protein BKA61DRAFT_705605 [Leptodontidium sp. MPI-SDFR-AT-0119]|nr:hypothetical protein BKA61DRAFT_705605 [Leptodontidium sp. MPI-SDFR-AT-0119]
MDLPSARSLRSIGEFVCMNLLFRTAWSTSYGPESITAQSWVVLLQNTAVATWMERIKLPVRIFNIVMVIFGNPVESKGINLEVATTYVGLEDLVQKFQEVTGKPVRVMLLTPEEYFAGGYEPLDIKKKLGYGTDGLDGTL